MEVDEETSKKVAGKQQQMLDNNGNGYAAASARLRRLADAVYAQRRAGNTATTNSELETAALAEFARMRAASRAHSVAQRASKAAAASTRSQMDGIHLAAHNRMYEVDHLAREIAKCNDYDSIYQTLDLEDDRDDAEMASDMADADAHANMVTRLKNEVAARQRAQADLKALLASKTKVIKDTEARKASLEQLEKQLDDFVTSAKAIRAKFESMS